MKKENIGQRAEQQALQYLQKNNLKIITSNYLVHRVGEIDLIMQDNNELVFIEVRYRANDKFGGAIESIGFQKQSKIKRTAGIYLLKHKQYELQPCRFDVILIQKNNIQWIKNAFD